MDIKLIYLGVPYTHPESNMREERFRKVSKYASHLMERGKYVYSPISHAHPIALAGKLPTNWDYWAEYDQFFLNLCHSFYILCLEGWEESKGVQAEYALALELGKPIFLVNEFTYKLSKAPECVLSGDYYGKTHSSRINLVVT